MRNVKNQVSIFVKLQTDYFVKFINLDIQDCTHVSQMKICDNFEYPGILLFESLWMHFQISYFSGYLILVY